MGANGKTVEERLSEIEANLELMAAVLVKHSMDIQQVNNAHNESVTAIATVHNNLAALVEGGRATMITNPNLN